MTSAQTGSGEIATPASRQERALAAERAALARQRSTGGTAAQPSVATAPEDDEGLETAAHSVGQQQSGQHSQHDQAPASHSSTSTAQEAERMKKAAADFNTHIVGAVDYLHNFAGHVQEAVSVVQKVLADLQQWQGRSPNDASKPARTHDIHAKCTR